LVEGSLTDYLNVLLRYGAGNLIVSILIKDNKSAHSEAGFFVVTVIGKTGFLIFALEIAVWEAA
jgi:hypothetical protein